MKIRNILTNLPVAVMLLMMGYFLTACNDDDTSSSQASEVKPEVMVLFSFDGLGDGSYNDQILRGIKLMENDHNQDMTIRFVTPSNMEEAEAYCNSWWENIDNPVNEKGNVPRRLLVLASSDYVDMRLSCGASAVSDSEGLRL